MTERLPSNDRSIHIYTYGLTGGIYEVSLQMDLSAVIHIHLKYHEDCFSHSEFDRGDTQIDIHTGTQTAWRSYKPTLIFSK
jgi:hypothetical protein